ncbi:enolase C-terminal domain-like protein [Weissella soli]|uniref:enolase C-terminal domain-like protein n=1 Tax=Weissella soli TaxID=155866 RepID=UPI0035A016F3
MYTLNERLPTTNGYVKQINLYPLELQLKTPFKTAHGLTTARPITLVELVWGDGSRGYGEIQSFYDAAYDAETQAISIAAIRAAAPAVFQNSIPVGMPSFARAALEMAFSAVMPAREGAQLISLPTMVDDTAQGVPVGQAIGIMPNAQGLTNQIEWAIDQGYQRIKLKLGAVPYDDVIAQVVPRFPTTMFSADGNGGFAAHDGLQRLQRLEDMGFTFIEQPFSEDQNELNIAAIKQLTSLRISLDESLHSIEDYERYRQTGALFTIKQAKIGGWRTAMHILQTDANAWVGGMLASGLGRSVDLALAQVSLTNHFAAYIPTDVSGSDRYFERDIIKTPMVIEHGAIQVPTQIELDWEAIHALQVTSTIEIRP